MQYVGYLSERVSYVSTYFVPKWSSSNPTLTLTPALRMSRTPPTPSFALNKCDQKAIRVWFGTTRELSRCFACTFGHRMLRSGRKALLTEERGVSAYLDNNQQRRVALYIDGAHFVRWRAGMTAGNGSRAGWRLMKLEGSSHNNRP